MYNFPILQQTPIIRQQKLLHEAKLLPSVFLFLERGKKITKQINAFIKTELLTRTKWKSNFGTPGVLFTHANRLKNGPDSQSLHSALFK